MATNKRAIVLYSGNKQEITSGDTLDISTMPTFYPDPAIFTGGGTSTSDYFTHIKSYVDQSGANIYVGSTTGTNTYVASLTPAITAYAAGQAFNVIFTIANSGAATININGLGAKSLVKQVSTALATGDLLAGRIYSIEYDGTNFQVNNAPDPLKAPLASPTFTGTPTLPTGTIATTQTAGNNTTAVATTAFATTADNLKANLASPTFTGTVTLPIISIGLASKVGIVEGTGGRVGQASLVAGTIAITITGITTSSRAFLQDVTLSGTTITNKHFAVCTANTLTVTAKVAAGTTDATDTSTFNYLVIN